MSNTEDYRFNFHLINFIKKHEGFKDKVYKCPAGSKTIGHGHRLLPYENYKSITKIEAENLLIKDLSVIKSQLQHTLKEEDIYNKLKGYQKDAILSLCYNWGVARFAKSKLLGDIVAKDFKSAAKEFLDINKVNRIPLKGLTVRREEEATIFLHSWEYFKEHGSTFN